MDLLVMPGPLVEGHADIEAKCEKCHKNFDQSAQDRLCLDCHEDIDKDIVGKLGYHGKDGKVTAVECRSCHTDHIGRTADINLLDADTFDHDLSDYPLEDAHLQAGCAQCHKKDELYRDAKSDCYSCHRDDDVHQGELGEECENCHDLKSWKKAGFDHDKTDFKLRDAHDKIECSACHPDEHYVDIPVSCNSCHKLNDVHAGSYGVECEDCHNEREWPEILFNHDRDTDYPLEGRHKNVSCKACHGNDVKRKLGTDCINCHKQDDAHRGRYGEKCEQCHSIRTWNEDLFNHDQDTDFKLNGAHKKISCEACHRGTLEDDTGLECVDCHLGDDAHHGEQGKQCEQCHGEDSWVSSVRFNHELTRLPLIGMHAAIPCEDCHLSAEYREAPLACNRCHEKDDVHKQKLDTNCELCHNPNHWSLWVFDHDKQSDYPLEGAHKDLDCLTCHDTPISNGKIELPADCFSCHAMDDIHEEKFGRQCERCHDLESFDMENRPAG